MTDDELHRFIDIIVDYHKVESLKFKDELVMEWDKSLQGAKLVEAVCANFLDYNSPEGFNKPLVLASCTRFAMCNKDMDKFNSEHIPALKTFIFDTAKTEPCVYDIIYTFIDSSFYKLEQLEKLGL